MRDGVFTHNNFLIVIGDRRPIVAVDLVFANTSEEQAISRATIVLIAGGLTKDEVTLLSGVDRIVAASANERATSLGTVQSGAVVVSNENFPNWKMQGPSTTRAPGGVLGKKFVT